MATERRPSTPTLEDATNSNAGAAKSLKAEGSAAASGGTNYDAGFVAKDGSGNLQFLKVNANRELVIDSDGSDKACLYAEGTIDDGVGTFTTVCEITLTNDYAYKNIEIHVSCFRDTVFKVEWVDDEGGGGETFNQLLKGRLGKESNYHAMMECLKFTAGAAGTQKLRIQAYNTGALSDIDATIAVLQDTTP